MSEKIFTMNYYSQHRALKIYIILVLVVMIQTRVVKRSPEEHVPHNSQPGFNEDLYREEFPPLRGIDPVLPPHLHYLEDQTFKERRLIDDVDDEFYLTHPSDKLRKNNSQENSSPQTDIAIATTETFEGEKTSINRNVTYLILSTDELSTENLNDELSSNEQKSRSSRENYHNSRKIQNSTQAQSVKEDELMEESRTGTKFGRRANSNIYLDPFNRNNLGKATTSAESLSFTSSTIDISTEDNQEDIVNGFMNRIQDHWIRFVQQMKNSVMNVWQSINNKVMNSLENFSVTSK